MLRKMNLEEILKTISHVIGNNDIVLFIEFSKKEKMIKHGYNSIEPNVMLYDYLNFFVDISRYKLIDIVQPTICIPHKFTKIQESNNYDMWKWCDIHIQRFFCELFTSDLFTNDIRLDMLTKSKDYFNKNVIKMLCNLRELDYVTSKLSNNYYPIISRKNSKIIWRCLAGYLYIMSTRRDNFHGKYNGWFKYDEELIVNGETINNELLKSYHAPRIDFFNDLIKVNL
jgi:hypothetical protein